MKIQKLLSILLVSGLIVSSASFATGHSVVKGKSNGAAIHMMRVTNMGYRYVTAKVTVAVGTMHNGLCYVGPQEAPVYFTFNPNSQMPLMLDGDTLQGNFGLGYDCGMMTLETDKQTTKDSFYLYNNGYRYYTTSPYYDDVNIN